MLVKCPECELQVSDKALSCPHCGYPFDKKIKSTKSNKRKRLPNGFGQICEIKNQNLRKRFRAMVTVGKNENGRYIVKPLKPESFFETYNDAYAALLEYNRNPYDLDSVMTVSELYNKWTTDYFAKLKSNSSHRTITAAWNYCSSIYNMRVMDVRARHIKGCIDEGTANINGVIKHPSATIKSRIKSLFNLMLDYALEYELVDKNYARTFALSDEIIEEKNSNYKSHISFTDDEMKILWDNLNKVNYVDMILFECYSGLRPQEVVLIKLENVFLDKGYFICGMKTEAGINRVVPIHPIIKNILISKVNEAKSLGSEYVFNCPDGRDDYRLTYDKYYKRFNKTVKLLGLNEEHSPHDCRKQFITLAKKYGLDEYAIKYIVGHKIEDITERVYTDREISWLITEMKKIK